MIEGGQVKALVACPRYTMTVGFSTFNMTSDEGAANGVIHRRKRLKDVGDAAVWLEHG
jgi:hypothetical protein